MKTEFWNARYKTENYAYGKEPNVFYKSEIDKVEPKTILFPLEGEGRNAVYAAKLGWQVSAFDLSSEGKTKALALAKENNTNINYTISELDNISYPRESFDCIVLIFAHFPEENRRLYHQKLMEYLKPGGKLILEGYSKKHHDYNSVDKKVGGPDNKDMLFSETDLREDFKDFNSLKITTKEYVLNEGLFHNGMSAVYQVVGVK